MKNCLDCKFNVGGICVFLMSSLAEYPYDCLYGDVEGENENDSNG